jgi:hypothetical protein
MKNMRTFISLHEIKNAWYKKDNEDSPLFYDIYQATVVLPGRLTSY